MLKTLSAEVTRLSKRNVWLQTRAAEVAKQYAQAKIENDILRQQVQELSMDITPQVCTNSGLEATIQVPDSLKACLVDDFCSKACLHLFVLVCIPAEFMSSTCPMASLTPSAIKCHTLPWTNLPHTNTPINAADSV